MSILKKLVESELENLSEKEREMLKNKLKTQKEDFEDKISEIIGEEYEKLNEGQPVFQKTPNEMAYLDFKKWAYKNRKTLKNIIQKAVGDGRDAGTDTFLALRQIWLAWANKEAKEWSRIPNKDAAGSSFGRALAVMMKKDNLIIKKSGNKLTDLSEGKLTESVIGIKTKANFKPLQLKGALEKAGIKGFQMNRLSVTLTVLNLDKKYFSDAKKIVDKLGLAVMMAKEAKIPAGHHKMPNGEIMADKDHVDEAEDYKYKKYVSKAFDKISDAMFEFRHAMGIKQLTNKDMKLKKKFEALQANIFALQREMRSDGLSEGKLTEAKLRAGDIIKMQDGEYGVVNKVKGKVAYIKLQSNPGSFHPIEADRATYKGKHKGKDLYNETVNEHTVNFSKEEMNALHKDGKVVKADGEGKEHTYIFSEGLNKKDVSYQLSIDYSGNTKPKVTKLDNKKMVVSYGYKTNPEDVIKSLQKLNPALKIKHTGWKDNSSGGGTHSFVFESKLNEMEINDPILVAIRARKTMLAKEKSAPKVKKISTKQYYKLMDAEIDLITQMKDATKEFDQMNSDMLHDAGQKGDNWSDADANKWGGGLDKLQTKVEKLAAKKRKVKSDIMNYRMS